MLSDDDLTSMNEILLWLTLPDSDYRKRIAKGIVRGYQEARMEDRVERERIETEWKENDPLRLYFEIVREEKRK